MGRTIVIVDDEPRVGNSIRRNLMDESDLHVHTFEKAMDAISFTQKNDVDVVVTDIMMPGIKGFDVCGELRKIDPFLQFIVITGYAKSEYVLELVRMGIHDILLKPFEPSELIDLLNQCFARIDRLKPLKENWT